jgi:hypothetical protein
LRRPWNPDSPEEHEAAVGERAADVTVAERQGQSVRGLDAAEAAPVRGVRLGAGSETLQVNVGVQASQSQSQSQG